MSPEQARGEERGSPVRHLVVGRGPLRMLTGRLPFRGDHEQAVTYQIVHEDARADHGIRTGVPMELERIVNKCLEKEASNRYQHVDEVLVDLRKVKKAPTPSLRRKSDQIRASRIGGLARRYSSRRFQPVPIGDHAGRKDRPGETRGLAV